jgi:hypothetical protein
MHQCCINTLAYRAPLFHNPFVSAGDCLDPFYAASARNGTHRTSHQGKNLCFPDDEMSLRFTALILKRAGKVQVQPSRIFTNHKVAKAARHCRARRLQPKEIKVMVGGKERVIALLLVDYLMMIVTADVESRALRRQEPRRPRPVFAENLHSRRGRVAHNGFAPRGLGMIYFASIYCNPII